MSASLAKGVAPIGRASNFSSLLTRKFEQDRLVIASHNPGKVAEIQDLLAPFAVTVVSAGALGLPEPEEIGDSFAANAALKARLAARAADTPALSDDSGLCVAALDGRPGIHSARWGGPERDWDLAMRAVWDGICAAEQAGHAGAAGRRARFVCALALAWPDGRTEIFEGEVTGRIVWPGRGQNGFGYDPIFVADGMTETFGEMEPARKHAISHRARAFSALVEACFAHRRRQG